MKKDRYEKIDKVGEGTYGVVYKAKDLKTNDIVAIKKMRLLADEEGIPSTAIREISLLKELNHVNVVRLVDVMHSIKKLTLVFEFVEKDLKKIIDSHNDDKNKGLDSVLVKVSLKINFQSFLYQLLKGVEYIHKNKIVHRDLKPQNLLISNDGIMKIADFGLARGYGIPVKNYTHEVVTLWYRPPDVLLGSKTYMTTIDIWSIGCIFAEMVNGKALFTGVNETDQLEKIFKILGTPTFDSYPGLEDLPDWSTQEFDLYKPQNLSLFVPKLDENGVDLLEKMLRINPKERLSLSEALAHPYLSDVSKITKKLYI